MPAWLEEADGGRRMEGAEEGEVLSQNPGARVVPQELRYRKE